MVGDIEMLKDLWPGIGLVGGKVIPAKMLKGIRDERGEGEAR